MILAFLITTLVVFSLNAFFNFVQLVGGFVNENVSKSVVVALFASLILLSFNIYCLTIV